MGITKENVTVQVSSEHLYLICYFELLLASYTSIVNMHSLFVSFHCEYVSWVIPLGGHLSIIKLTLLA